MLSFAWFCKRNGCERLSSKLYETSISRDVNSSGERFAKAVQTPNVSGTQKKTRRFRWPYVFIVTFEWSSITDSRKQLIAPPISCSKMKILVACFTDLWQHTLRNNWVTYFHGYTSSKLLNKYFKAMPKSHCQFFPKFIVNTWFQHIKKPYNFFILQHACKNSNIMWIILTFTHVKQANFALQRQLNLYK